MKTPRLCLLVMLVWVGTAISAHAETYLVDGLQGCLEIGGEWQSDSNGCLVHRLVIAADDRLVVASSISFRSDGTVFNYGRMETLGGFSSHGPLNNRGVLITAGLTVNGAPIINTGTWVNRGWVHTHDGISNYGVFENAGYLETCSGPIYNYAYMHNISDIDNWGGLIVNHGILVNDNRIYNPDDPYYHVLNSGALENRGTIENGGTLSNACGAAFYGPGSLLGNPGEYEACDPALAIQLLTSRLFDAGTSGALPKNDVKNLTAYLARATKHLAVHDRDSAAGEVNAFIGDVRVLLDSEKVVRYLGAAFVGWGERIVAILST